MKGRIVKPVFLMAALLATLAITVFGTQVVEASISQLVCTKAGTLNAIVTASSAEKYAGASLKTNKGKIVDLKPRSLRVGSNTLMWTFVGRFDISQYRISTWRGMGGGLMKGRVSDTGWRSCQ